MTRQTGLCRLVKVIGLSATIVSSACLVGCATTSAPARPDDAKLTAIEFSDQFNFLDASDPLESVNRRIYKFNAKLDEYLFLPVIRIYEDVTPHFFRTGVSNFFSNINQITVLSNSILQLKPESATTTLGRIAVNTTLGIAGLWDPATRFGLARQNEDFGQTLGHYGVAPGPYLVLPILGPSDLRDGLGLIPDRLLRSQLNFLDVDDAEWDYPPLLALEILDQRYINPFRYGQFGSPFEYDLVRYLYLKQREFLVDH